MLLKWAELCLLLKVIIWPVTHTTCLLGNCRYIFIFRTEPGVQSVILLYLEHTVFTVLAINEFLVNCKAKSY